jgi:hypothetical protein
VITCNKCGYNAPSGAYKCPSCGSPLSTRMEGGPGPRTGGQDQAEIPAWLETLRVGERPAAPANNSTNFSAADLIEEGSLPSWMHSGRSQSSVSSVSDAFNALHPASGPNPLMDQGSIPQRGLDAQSLVDENSLPSWMREGAPSTPSRGFEASSLVDSEALPEWMRSLQPPQPSPSGPQPVRPAPDTTPEWMRSLQPPQPSPSGPQAIQATPDTTPEWMRSLPSPSSTFSAPSAPPPMPTMSRPEPVAPPSAGFSARDLLDEQSLPSWMTQQSGAQPAVPSNGMPAQPGSLSPASLVDPNSLPNWMREGANAPSSSRIPSPPAQSSPSRPIPVQPSMQAPLTQNPGQNGGFAASSFVDSNSLPDWLRSGAGQPSASVSPQPSPAMPPQPEPLRTGVYNGPPRVENMRVPSRPRGEASPNDGSEVAANVFASMLGVASAAPQLPPSSAPQGPYGQPQPNPYAPAQSSPQNSPMGMPGQIPAYNTPPMAQQGPMPNAGPGNYGANYTGNLANRTSLGVPSTGAMTPQAPYNGASAPRPNTSVQNDDQQAPKKRGGLVDTLLGWLLH